MDRGQVFVILAAFLSILNTVNYVEGQSTVLTWRVVDEGNNKSFYFSPDNMRDFLGCVCAGNTLWCQLYYSESDSRGTYVSGRENVTQSDIGSNMFSNIYSCRRTSSNAAYVKCERQTTTACTSVSICWSYQFSEFQGSCQLGTVGFTWASDQTFTQNVHQKVTVTNPCNRSCSTQTTAGWTMTTSTSTSRSSTTTTADSTTTSRPTSTTTVTTTTTPATVKPVTTTTTTSSSTSASTTGGGGNAPQKDDSSDDTGVIVGVVIAVLVVTAALIVGGIFWWRRRKNAEKSDRSLGNNVTVVHTSAFGITNHAFARSEDQEGGTPDLLYAQVPADDPIGSRQNSAQYSNVQIKPMPNGKGPNHSYENVQRPVKPSSENSNHDNSNGVTSIPENPDGDQQLYFTNTDHSHSPPRFVITPKTDAQSDGMDYEDVSRFAEPDPGTTNTNIPSSATNNSNNINDNFYEIPIVPPNITNSASNPPNNLKSTNNSTAKPKSQNVYSEVDEIATSNSIDDIIPPQRTRFNVVPTSNTPEPANDVYELAQAIDTTDFLAATGKPQVAPKVARKPKGRKKKEVDKDNHVYFELESAASIRLDGPYSVEDKHEDDDDDEERYTENPYEDPDKQQSNDSQYSVI